MNQDSTNTAVNATQVDVDSIAKAAFERGRANGEQLELLRAAVAARVAYWDAFRRLEKAVTTSGQFSDKASDAVGDHIEDLATGANLDPNIAHQKIIGEHVARIHDIVERYPFVE